MSTDFQKLQRLFLDGNLPDVMLFEGRKGSLSKGMGKSKVLRRIAALHVCKTQTACGQCPPCQAIESDRHPDVLFVEESSESLKVEDIRDLSNFLSFAPQGDSPYARRIVILRNVETLTRPAVNKLLKTLEEPPPYGRILLSTQKAKVLLPTLLSRCVRWRLRPEGDLLSTRDSDNELLALAKQLLTLRDAAKIVEFCEMVRPTIAPRLFDFIQEFEYSLNLLYRQALSDQSFKAASLRHRRKVLHDIKDIVGRQRIALNPQLVLETLGFCNL